jgi:predicted enzyme related to lactoylglutathione lyase
MITNDSFLKLKGMSPVFLVADLHESVAFYTGQLGFELKFIYEDFYAGIAKDVYSIHLKSGSLDHKEIATRQKNEDIHLSFSVEHIEQLYKELQSRAVEIIQPLREMPYGWEFYIKDPNGYALAFIKEN